MFEVYVKQVHSDIVIKWLFTKIKIPIADILSIATDDTYGGKAKTAIRIGMPYDTTDRVVIVTKESIYILFTTNPLLVHNKLKSFIHAS